VAPDDGVLLTSWTSKGGGDGGGVGMVGIVESDPHVAWRSPTAMSAMCLRRMLILAFRCALLGHSPLGYLDGLVSVE
jgi:hypothetical protein